MFLLGINVRTIILGHFKKKSTCTLSLYKYISSVIISTIFIELKHKALEQGLIKPFLLKKIKFSKICYQNHPMKLNIKQKYYLKTAKSHLYIIYVSF